MRSTYKILAFTICVLVVAQAAFVVYGDAGLFKWIEDGGVLDKAALEDESLSFTGLGGFILHGMNGMMLIPLVALATLVVSFFTRVPRASAMAAAIVGLVALQITFGLVAHSLTWVGPLHGINAFLLFGTALIAGRMMSRAQAQTEAPAQTQAQAPTTGKDATVPGQPASTTDSTTASTAGSTQIQA